MFYAFVRGRQNRKFIGPSVQFVLSDRCVNENKIQIPFSWFARQLLGTMRKRLNPMLFRAPLIWQMRHFLRNENLITQWNSYRWLKLVFMFFKILQYPIKPDAVFPNNWISTHANGLAILYPMMAENRRTERSLEILSPVNSSLLLNDIFDLSHFEEHGQYLEGTGSLVFDHINQLAYACISERTDEMLAHLVCEKLTYEPIIFRALDANNKPIYHTNVMLSIGEKFAVVCLDSIADTAQRTMVFDSLLETKQDVIPISMEQDSQFAGNILQLENLDGQKVIVLSRTALESFTQNQKEMLQRHGELVPLNIPTIERIGGGSARCMIAELFLPQKM